MKRRFCLVAALLLLFLFSGAGAEITPVIQDDADLLTAEEETALIEVMAPICEYGTPVFWTTTQSGDYRSKAENFYYRLLGNDSGALFVIDMSARQLTLLTNGEILRVVGSGEASTITDNVYRMARQGEYAACAEEAFREVMSLLRGEQIARPMKLVSNVLLALVLALLAVYLFVSRHYENRKKVGKAGGALPVTAGAAAAFTATLTAGRAIMTRQQKINISSGSGGHGGGGHGGGGGGGGGGFSGGGGSHGF